MNLKPVKHYQQPKYPTQDYLLAHPELLRLVPERWRGNRIVLTALGAAALLIMSCQAKTDNRSNTVVKTKVAPIFVHGEGRLYWAGKSPEPPFLTEAEARKIANEEVAAIGLHFIGTDSLKAPEVTVKIGHIQPFPRRADIHGGLLSNYHDFSDSNVVLDGYDPTHNIGFEYLAYLDGHTWGTNYSRLVEGYVDILEAANRLHDGIESAAQRPNTGIFYASLEPNSATERTVNSHTGLLAGQPLISSERNIEELLAGSPNLKTEWELHKKKAGHDLDANDFSYWYPEYAFRAQVRDFIQWLKSEGII